MTGTGLCNNKSASRRTSVDRKAASAKKRHSFLRNQCSCHRSCYCFVGGRCHVSPADGSPSFDVFDFCFSFSRNLLNDSYSLRSSGSVSGRKSDVIIHRTCCFIVCLRVPKQVMREEGERGGGGVGGREGREREREEGRHTEKEEGREGEKSHVYKTSECKVVMATIQ